MEVLNTTAITFSTNTVTITNTIATCLNFISTKNVIVQAFLSLCLLGTTVA